MTRLKGEEPIVIPEPIQRFIDQQAERSPTDYSDLGAVFLNGTLKRSPGKSHTGGLMAVSIALLRALGVRVDVVRIGLGNADAPALVRVQSECLTGDVFGSQRCDCGAQLQQALALIAAQPGALIYLRGHEGRGVGLLAKLEAYWLQDEGLDTVVGQLALGLPVDSREYAQP